jgi:hypothetical protein
MVAEVSQNMGVEEEPRLDNIVNLEGEFLRISHVDRMRPFFMSVVSDADHWLFVSSNGGISAGRKHADQALFPYYTDDKITESVEHTGCKTIIKVKTSKGTALWEPFSGLGHSFNIQRNLYKSKYGNAIGFEEINHSLELRYSYYWSSSKKYGFVRKAQIENFGDTSRQFTLLDGLQNLIPSGVGQQMQNTVSNLVDAYKRSEVLGAHLAIFSLSAIIVDKAEPSEALKTTSVWSNGLSEGPVLLSSLQLQDFREGRTLRPETDMKGERGAYFLRESGSLEPGTQKEWELVCDVNQNHGDIAKLRFGLQDPEKLIRSVREDVAQGTENLKRLCAASDAFQFTADPQRDTRHYSNTLFNIMRGGIFDDGYSVDKSDFETYLDKANSAVSAQFRALFLAGLPPLFNIQRLHKWASQNGQNDLKRLCFEYLPLKFSRRHGDPSRPWNKFTINVQDEAGRKVLDYEGNWRDIFQNWEALACSYPGFIEPMIHKFLNASTFDGYNPYRLTKDGFDYEIIEPDDPWSYIGYWGDHQIIYLLKLLEQFEAHNPGRIATLFDADFFVYAQVPYRIKSYEAIVSNPKDTIIFDEEQHALIQKRKQELGADGALLRDTNNTIHTVNFIEKIMATTLAKLANLVPGTGIWMNTQRPEWNDANNALVGNGVSMVTLCYLRRFVVFFDALLQNETDRSVNVSKEILPFFEAVFQTLEAHAQSLGLACEAQSKRSILDQLGSAVSTFRDQIYIRGFSGKKLAFDLSRFKNLLSIAIQVTEFAIRENKREDGLYHAYNIMTFDAQGGVRISHLDPMLEGQVAVLSSGYLSTQEVIANLDALRKSPLFREDQYSYLLYPEKELPGFLHKNNIPKKYFRASDLLMAMQENEDARIAYTDVLGQHHFNGDFRNVGDLEQALDNLSGSEYSELATREKQPLLALFEAVFQHRSFTGRSGTFYGYEGLGSIYWHMVSKLQLAVMENCHLAHQNQSSDQEMGRLLDHYYEINEGIGVHKSPKLYGALPTDPYSHTPKGRGAQQPGMTGQVKEDILSRFGELGVQVQQGQIHFDPFLLRKNEYHSESQIQTVYAISTDTLEVKIPKNGLCFTYCQVPITYVISEREYIVIKNSDGTSSEMEGLRLSIAISTEIFERSGKIEALEVHLATKRLK